MALSCTQINVNSFILLEVDPGLDPRNFTDRMFTATVIVGNSSFSKSFGRLELNPLHQMYAKTLSIPEYIKLTAKGLREQPELQHQGQKVILKWFKPIQDNALKSILGILEISQDTNFSITMVLTKLTKSHGSLMTKIQDLRQQTATVTTERDECLVKYEKLVEEKERTDAEVFKKFKEVLNAKKQKIRTLMEMTQ